MSDIYTILFKKFSYANGIETLPTAHPHSAFLTTVWIMGIGVCTVLYYLIYCYPVSLHDISHFITAGVSQIRDHKDLLYPYFSNLPGGIEPAYQYFQDNSIQFDTRTNYPSKLYSTLYGFIFVITGKMRFLYAQWLSLAAIVTCNILLYLVGSRFFKGITLFCFIIITAFLPVMRSSLIPSNDVFGYLSCLFLLWLCVCLRINPFVAGLVAGVLCHFRAQSLSIMIVLPVIIYGLCGHKFFRQVLVPLISGVVITYGIISFVYKISIVSTGNSNPIAFYIDFYSRSFYGFNEFNFICNNIIDNIINIFDKNQLFILAYVALICTLLRNTPIQRGFAIGGILYVAVPLLIYSIDRYSAPHNRYYISAVPMLVLAGFISAKTFDCVRVIRSNIIIVLTTVIVCFSWYNVHGLPIKRLGSLDTISSRLRFLDFDGVEMALRINFEDDDLVVINHSLPTALSMLHNVIYIPTFEAFRNGDNREIDGIIFVYSNQSPNDFFMPKDWMIDGKLPDEITDSRKVSFKKIYSATSQLLNYEGSLDQEAFFYIYKNTDSGRKPSRDSSGKRIFNIESGSIQTTQRIISPNFDDPKSWGTGFQRARDFGKGVIVGPGPNNANVLYQRFPAFPGERFNIIARASSTDGSIVNGRIQVNWLGDNDQYISTSIKVIVVNKDEQVYEAIVFAPAGTKTGMIYVSPHGQQDVVRYTEMNVLGGK